MSDAAIDLEMLLEHTAESFETEEWCLGDLHERLGAYSAHDQVTHRMLASIIVEQLNPAVASQWLEIAYGTRRTVGELRREIAENLLSADMDPDYGHVHPGRAPTPAQATGIA